jgi:cytochrome c biogenesis protein
MALRALRQVWDFLTRLKVAAVLILILLLLAALGSCFPQFSSPAAVDAEQLAQWEAHVQARYGVLRDLLGAVRVFQWFKSPVFLVPLVLLAVVTLMCTLDRWRVVCRRAVRSPVSGSDAVFTAAPHTSKLTGLPAADLPCIVRECLRKRGFRVRSGRSGDAINLRGERNQLATLATLVTHLALLFLLLGAGLSYGWGWREEFIIGPDELVEVGHGSSLALRNDGFSMSRYPDGSVSTYQAQLAVIRGGQEVKRGSVWVNQPLTCDGVGFYLQGYQGGGNSYSVSLLAVHDPGYGWVVAALFILLVSTTVTLNFPRGWIQARIDAGGLLRLAGWAERHAFDFEREFAALVRELSHWAGSTQEDVV